MEIEYFVRPENAEQYFDAWVEDYKKFLQI